MNESIETKNLNDEEISFYEESRNIIKEHIAKECAIHGKSYEQMCDEAKNRLKLNQKLMDISLWNLK